MPSFMKPCLQIRESEIDVNMGNEGSVGVGVGHLGWTKVKRMIGTAFILRTNFLEQMRKSCMNIKRDEYYRGVNSRAVFVLERLEEKCICGLLRAEESRRGACWNSLPRWLCWPTGPAHTVYGEGGRVGSPRPRCTPSHVWPYTVGERAEGQWKYPGCVLIRRISNVYGTWISSHSLVFRNEEGKTLTACGSHYICSYFKQKFD